VMCEDVAKSTQIALALGNPIPLTQEQIDGLYNRYQNVYGNK
jgi:L-ribulose-5-phosphate 4-epimerase